MATSTDTSLEPRALWRSALAQFRTLWRPLLALHLMFSLLGLVLFAPLFSLTSRLLLRLSGEPAVADQDIAAFLLSPAGLVAGVLAAALLLGIIVFEQTGMMRITLGAKRDQAVGTADALLFTAVKSHAALLFSAHLVVRLLLITAPFLAVAAVLAARSIADYDINYYLSERPPEFVRAAILIGLVLLLGAGLLVRKLIGWSIALPLVLFADVPPRRSFAASTDAVAGHRRPIAVALLFWALTALVLGILVLGTVRVVGGLIVPSVAADLSALVIVLGLLAVLLTVGNMLVTCANGGLFAALQTDIADQLAAAAELPLVVPAAATDRPPLLTPARVLLGLLLAGAVAFGGSLWALNEIHIDDDVQIIAHRGAAGRAPENTLAAVAAAIDDGADWVEIDVQESAEGEVIVVHDSDFMKLSGNPLKIWDATRAELDDIDVGSWFDPSFADERVPTLAQVLTLARGKAKVVIELKYYGHDERLEERVAAVVTAMAMSDQVAIMSLKYEGVQKMQQLQPAWNVGLLSATAIGNLARLDSDFLAVSTAMASRGFTRRAQEAGKQVFVWTVNDAVSMSNMISRGVDGLITDEPALAREVLAERAALSTPQRLLLHASSFFGRDFTSREYRDDSP